MARRRLVFYGAVTLDGYLAGTDEQLGWLHDTYLGENGTTYDDFIQSVDCLVMGRVTFEETMALVALNEWIGERDIIVFSRDQHFSHPDPRVRVVHQEPVAFLRTLAEQDGADIWLVGGGNLLHPILEADLVDEWWIQIAPVLLGQGKRLFEPGDYADRLAFVETKQMGDLVELHYRRQA